jgi:hypothetical protein
VGAEGEGHFSAFVLEEVFNVGLRGLYLRNVWPFVVELEFGAKKTNTYNSFLAAKVVNLYTAEGMFLPVSLYGKEAVKAGE